MSTVELQGIVEKLLLSQAETGRQIEATDRQMKATDRKIKELGKQIGGLGNKFGTFAEGLAYASIRKILREDFGMETVTPRFEIQKGGDSEEYDVLAYSNGGMNRGVVVEVKSLLDRRAIKQMREKMERLFEWMPEHRDKEFQGIVAYVDAAKEVRDAVLEEGWHLIHVGEDLFEVETPPGFKPRIYRATPSQS